MKQLVIILCLAAAVLGAIAGISAKNVSVKLVRIKQQLMKMSDNQEC